MHLDFICQTMFNFKAFTGTHNFDWDLPGVIFIKGDNKVDKGIHANGAAKSTIFDAWCWCLFGRTARGLRNPDVVPWYSRSRDPGATSVTLELAIDGSTHTLRRWTGSKNGLTWDGDDIDQDKLNAKLGLNFVLATNTVLLAQGDDLFFDLTPEKKMELFAETLQLDRWDDRSELAADKLKDAEVLAMDSEAKMNAINASVAEVDTTLAETRRHAESWANEQRSDKRFFEAQLKGLEHDLAKQQKLLDAATLAEDEACVEIKHHINADKQLETELRNAAAELRHAQIRVEEAQRQLDLQEENLKELESTKTCPACGQPVKKANLANHKAGVEQAIKKLEAIIDAGIPDKISATIDAAHARLKANSKALRGFEDQRDAARAACDRLRPEVSDLTAHIKVVKRTMANAAENPHHAQIKTLEARRKDLGQQFTLVEKDFSAAVSAAERYRYWKTGFKDIKLQLIEEVLGELEIVTNGMLADVGLDGWMVHYDIERETKSGTIKRALHVEISSPESKGFVKWQAWSGGEGQRLKLVGALALADVLLAKAGVETNIEILDEPALYWSAAGVQDLSAFLSDRAKQLRRGIFYVEHTAAESAHFSTVLTVIKDADGAYIEKE